jgi:hypothetical protein
MKTKMKSKINKIIYVCFCLLAMFIIEYGQNSNLPIPKIENSSLTKSSRIAALQTQIQKGNQSALNQFWQKVKKTGTPLIETIPGDKQNVLVTFIRRGTSDTRNIVVFFQSGGVNPADNQMSKLPDSDVWYRSYIFPKDVRFLYSLSMNDDLTPLNAPNIDFMKRFANLHPDPLNPKHFPTNVKPGVVIQSVVEAPNAPPQPWVVRRAGVFAGK